MTVLGIGEEGGMFTLAMCTGGGGAVCRVVLCTGPLGGLPERVAVKLAAPIGLSPLTFVLPLNPLPW